MSAHVATRRGAFALLIVALGASAAFVACDLNPQPLPPGGGEERTGVPAPNPEAPGGGFGESPTDTNDKSADASSAPATDAGASDAGDAGTTDAGDGG